MQEQNLSKTKRLLKKKIKIPLIPFTIFISIILLRPLCLKLVGYTGYLPKAQVVEMVKKLESQYIYHEVFDKEEYKNLKDNFLNKRIYSKQDSQEFLYGTRALADDIYTFFYFDDYISKNGSDIYSRIMKLEDDFKYEIKDKNLGYIYFTSFKNGTAERFVDALEFFKQHEVKELVIDLRKNGGGNTAELITIADALLPKAQIYTGKYKNLDIIYYSDEAYMEFDQIFILLSNESASCAEMLPLTLKENLGDKVVLIGNETRKKAVGQTSWNEYNYRFSYYIVSYRWLVNDKDVNDLNDYLKLYDKKFNQEDIEAYLKVVYENL